MKSQPAKAKDKDKSKDKTKLKAKDKARGIKPAIVIDVSLSYVGTGGNAGDGAYHFHCKPYAVHVTENDTVLQYEMVGDMAVEYQFAGFYSTDSLENPQLSAPSYKAKGRVLQVTHANRTSALIDIVLRVQDTKRMVAISCDPQATNDPGT
ncbi:MAG TPA: hypothetical protein VGO76_11360 [Luteibacter sp.]|nr:hypothetical protein [Luteibacter sp.]